MKKFIPVMLTPFRDSGAIDYHMLARLTEFYLEAGAGGLFANCLSSEMFELTEAERLAVIAEVMRVAGGAVPVVATGTFGGPVNKQADFVKRVYDLGATAVIGITGLLAEPGDEEHVLEKNLELLFDLTPGIPMGLYECPVPYKRIVSPALLGRLAATGRLTYHKDTCLDIGQVREKIGATADAPGFGLYDAYMVHAVESLRAGAKGLSCIQGNFFPELVVWLCHNFENSALSEEVNLAQEFFVRNMDVMHEVYPLVAKVYLQDRGFGMPRFTRRKVGALTPEITASLGRLRSDYVQLQRRLELKA